MTALNFDTVANAEDRATVHYTVPKNGTKTSGRMGGLLNSLPPASFPGQPLTWPLLVTYQRGSSACARPRARVRLARMAGLRSDPLVPIRERHVPPLVTPPKGGARLVPALGRWSGSPGWLVSDPIR